MSEVFRQKKSQIFRIRAAMNLSTDFILFHEKNSENTKKRKTEKSTFKTKKAFPIFQERLIKSQTKKNTIHFKEKLIFLPRAAAIFCKKLKVGL